MLRNSRAKVVQQCGQCRWAGGNQRMTGFTRGFGFTPGELLTLSKPHPYPTSENIPALKWFSEPNL